MTWKQDANQAFIDSQAEEALQEAQQGLRDGSALGKLLLDILGERFEPTSEEFTDLGVTFVLRREAEGREVVFILSPPNNEDEVVDLTSVGRVLADRGL